MALRIKQFDESSLGVLNRWANQQETVVQQHQTQINNLQGALNKLIESNPTLKDIAK